MTIIRTYSELIKLDTFDDRFKYLKLNGQVGQETFGFERYLNQRFYRTKEWKELRDFVIVRDNGCDLGIRDLEIYDSIFVHHMNQLTKYDVIHRTDKLLNPEYLISTSKRTHDAIHYGNMNILNDSFVERKKNDTCPWRR